jgi:hypothetical protein
MAALQFHLYEDPRTPLTHGSRRALSVYTAIFLRDCAKRRFVEPGLMVGPNHEDNSAKPRFPLLRCVLLPELAATSTKSTKSSEAASCRQENTALAIRRG